jgi:DNA-binding MarR family transcriptional regulator
MTPKTENKVSEFMMRDAFRAGKIDQSHCILFAKAIRLQYILHMNDANTITALRLLQVADDFKAGLSGELSAVHGISVNEFLLLLLIDRSPANRLSRVDLAKRMHVSASTVTRMAAPMEKVGLIDREVDERDARLLFVVATDAGREKLSHALSTFSKRAGYLFSDRWEDEEIEHFAAMLRRLIAGSGDRLA